MAEELQPERKKATFKPILWVFMFTVLLVTFTGQVILFTVGMAPSLVAFMVDRTPKKYAAICVGALNFTGVFPKLGDLWRGTNDFSGSIAIITNIFELTVMYAAAAFGWLIFMAIPPVVAALMLIVTRQRIIKLRSEQRELVNEWGQDIAQSHAGSSDAYPSKTAGNRREVDAPPV